MPELDARKRARLPDSAFAYVDSRGRRRLPINDEAHVRNALARFNQVRFEDQAARERARKRLLAAAKRYGIVPIGFISGEFRAEGRRAAAGRLVIELGRVGAAGELEGRLRTVLHDPGLTVLHWSEAGGAYLDGTGRPVPLPAVDDARAVTLLERDGRPMTAIVHDPAVLVDRDVVQTVTGAVRFVIDRDRLRGEIQASTTDAASLPTGFVTFLLTDVEASTAILHRLGDRYVEVLSQLRALIRVAVSRAGGREVDARADEFFGVFDRPADAVAAAVAIQREVGGRTWPDDEVVRVRIGIHSGRPTLTETGYVGMAVHTAARVCSAAHGGQVLLSGGALAALWDSEPPGLSFRDLGPHRLPGLPRAERLFQLVADDIDERFPPPRTGTRSAEVRPPAP